MNVGEIGRFIIFMEEKEKCFYKYNMNEWKLYNFFFYK